MPEPSVSPSLVHSPLVGRLGAVADFRSITEGLDSRAFAFRRAREEILHPLIERVVERRPTAETFRAGHAPRVSKPEASGERA